MAELRRRRWKVPARFLTRNRSSGPARGLTYLLSRLRAAAEECLPRETAPQCWPHFKFLARGLVYGFWMKRWFEFLEIEPMRPVARLYTRLYLKIQWPYLNRGYGAGKRLQMVRHHYQFLLNRISPGLRGHLLNSKFLTLTRWDVPELGPFSLRLSQENKFSQEGEMVLALYQDKPERLCTLLCFSVTAHREISIGCLQGNKPLLDAEPSNKDFNVVLTRRMHGMRPKNLVLFTLHQLAAAWSIEHVRAVGNRSHIFRDSLRSDYDLFWTEAGGVAAADGMYDLPSTPQLRTLEDVSPKKRAMYRRRYEFLETLEREIAATLADPPRELATFGT